MNLRSILRNLLDADPEILTYLKIQAHFYTLWGYLTLEALHRPPAVDLAPRYAQFLAGVVVQLSPEAVTRPPNNVQSGEISYAMNTRGANTDLKPRLARHHALSTALHGANAQIDEDQ